MLPLLSIEDLCIDFVAESGNTAAVRHISLSVNKGEILALVGESGSGKSVTALSILRLLPEPPARYSHGKILLHEGNTVVDLLKADAKKIRAARGSSVAMIFQEPMSSLNPVMTCGAQVMEALLVHKKASKAKARQLTLGWFEKVQLPQPAITFDKYPHELSGGQKQRVMIAMAMCCQPSLLICDEPTTALDVTVQKTILQLIKQLQQEQDMGVIFITHDLGVVKEIADKVAIMYRGEIVEQNTAHQIFSAPEHLYTRALIACRPALHPKGEKLPIVSDFLQQTDDAVRIAASGRAETVKSQQPMITVKDLVVRFANRTGLLGKPKSYFTAVNHVSFQVFEGETLGLVGESGCGKTTLGRTLLKLAQPSSGEIIYRNNDLNNLTDQQLLQLRKDVQLVFQDPFSSLNPRLTIGAAIAEPMKVAGIESSGAKRKQRVAELLEKVNLSSGMMNRYPHEFSGGQRQRIVIARALAVNPHFLVCDESVSALDVSVQAQVLNLLNDLKKDLGLTMLFISHDLSVVRYMSDRIMVMNKGTIVESGPAEMVYQQPVSNYTKQLIDAIPQL
jgi:peptide/nickel transport system ATP-binding protein